MRAICLYLHIHQPVRYREYSIFDVGMNSNYFQDNYNGRQSNERIFRKVADKSYRPMLSLLEKNIVKYPDFKVSFSITGTWLEQAEKWAPDLIEQIKYLVSRGQVEIVGETYYHSLAFFLNLKIKSNNTPIKLSKSLAFVQKFSVILNLPTMIN